MKFKYKKYGPGILRPVIPIEIRHKNISVPYEVLVDSGADICIFDAQIAEILGINVKDGERHQVAGITCVAEDYYLHLITVGIGGWPYKIKAGFLPNMGKLSYGVVGQKGFFDIFIVKFDLKKEEIELKRRLQN